MRTIKKDSRKEVLEKVDLKRLRKLKGLQAKEAEYQSKRLLVYYDEERAKLDKEHRDEIVKELKEKTKNGTMNNIVNSFFISLYLNRTKKGG